MRITPTHFMFVIAAAAGILVATAADAQRRRPGGNAEAGALRAGQYAPTFELKSLDGEDTFDLRTFRGERPVILFFGSYT